MPLYFAYGSNMDEAAMGERCPRSLALGPAILHRHRIVIMKEGYASLVRDPRAQVYGLLWDVALGDVRALDQYESVGCGLYSKAAQRVKRISADAVRPLVQAIVYFGRGAGGGTPHPGYLDNVMACAEKLAFPRAYLGELRRLGNADPARFAQNAKVKTAPQLSVPRTAERDENGNIIVRPRFNSPADRQR